MSDISDQDSLSVDQEDNNNEDDAKSQIDAQFQLDGYPPWYIIVVSALQQVLGNLGGPMSLVYIMHANLCAPQNNVLFAELLSTAMFMGGICTLLQVVFGVRLPVLQASSSSFLPPIIAMMATEEWRCPETVNNGTVNGNSTDLPYADTDNDHLWQPRLMEISGSLMVASCTQLVLGCSGAMGFLMNFIGPLTITPAVALVGFSLFRNATNGAKEQWGIAMMTLGLLVIFSLILGKLQVPFIGYSKKKGWHKVHYPFFKLFPHVLALGITWLFCYILTITDVFPSDPEAVGYKARTDVKLDVMQRAEWFFWPYPGRWGWPTFGVGIFVGMVASTIASIIESFGDYYATARICGVPSPPKHAVNRGIAMEGFGSILCGLMGAGHATTSYSETVAFIGLTGIRCRIVWIVYGFFMIVFGVIGKVGAALSIVPEPILGGLATAGLGMVISIGLTNIKHLDVSSSRNLLILGISMMLGVMVPTWINENPGVISTGNSEADQVLTVLLSTGMFVGGVLGCFLDNVIPGTRRERGILALNARDTHSAESSISDVNKVYDIPYVSEGMRKIKCCIRIPFLPSYVSKPLCKNGKCCRRDVKSESYTSYSNKSFTEEIDEPASSYARKGYFVRNGVENTIIVDNSIDLPFGITNDHIVHQGESGMEYFTHF